MASFNHQMSDFAPHARSCQSLPAIPEDEVAPQFAQPKPLEPYHDDPAGDEDEVEDNRPLGPRLTILPDPPKYEPMHDYLASRGESVAQMPPEYAIYNPRTQSFSFQRYRDADPEPHLVDIEPPPPAYELEMGDDDDDADDTSAAEDICKWVVCMALIALSVAAVGTMFNWGQRRDCGTQC